MVHRKPLSVLEKRVPSNPRYAHIQPKVQTGATMKNAVVLSDKTIARRRNEIFDRISASGFLALLTDHQPDQESVYNVNTDSPVVSVVIPSESLTTREDKKILVFDFSSSSFPGAVRYSVGRLLRDDVSVELWRAKDQRLFVFADDDKTTVAATALLVQKGWPLAVAVSGGYDEINKATSTAPSTATSAPSPKPSAR